LGAVTKICPICKETVAIGFKNCPICGHIFEKELEAVNKSGKMIEVTIGGKKKKKETIFYSPKNCFLFSHFVNSSNNLGKMMLAILIKFYDTTDLKVFLDIERQISFYSYEKAIRIWKELTGKKDTINFPRTVREAIDRQEEIILPKRLPIKINRNGFREIDIKKLENLFEPEGESNVG
jgi:hypothetical protein